MNDQITRAKPEPLPTTIQDLMSRRQRVAPPNLNDKVEKHILCDEGPIVRKSPPLPAVPIRKRAAR